LFDYLHGLPNSTNCFLISALLRELEESRLISVQAMFLWAYARYIEEKLPGLPHVAPSAQKLCNEAIETLSKNKNIFFQKYQSFIENLNIHKFKHEYKSTYYLSSMVKEFVSFYFNGDVKRTKNLLKAVDAIRDIDTVGQILSSLHEEMDKKKQLSTFEAFKLQNIVKKILSRHSSTSKCHHWKYPFVQLKNKAPTCVRQLLYSDRPFECFLENGLHSNTLLNASYFSGARYNTH
jgi:hypothetical protein